MRMSDACPSCPSQKPADHQPAFRKTAIQLTTDAGASSVKTTQLRPAKTVIPQNGELNQRLVFLSH